MSLVKLWLRTVVRDDERRGALWLVCSIAFVPILLVDGRGAVDAWLRCGLAGCAAGLIDYGFSAGVQKRSILKSNRGGSNGPRNHGHAAVTFGIFLMLVGVVLIGLALVLPIVRDDPRCS